MFVVVFFFKQKTAYEMRISDWSSDVCSSDLHASRCGGCGLRAGGGGCQYLVECRAGLADRPETGRRPERGRVGRGFIRDDLRRACRSEEHTSELQSLMRISYAVFCLKKKNKPQYTREQTI